MTDDPRDLIDDLVSENAKAGPKNPKAAARQKFNRRKLWLADALEKMDRAIEDLLGQGGTVYKREEIDTLSSAIAAFREATGLEAPEMTPLTQQELDGFMDMLENLKPWEPPSKEELAELYASIGLAGDPAGKESGQAPPAGQS